MKARNEFTAAMSLCSARLPLVPIEITSRGAGWFGKWSFNASTAWVESIGGPFATRDEAIKAALATGHYRLREGTERPHLDPI